MEVSTLVQRNRHAKGLAVGLAALILATLCTAGLCINSRSGESPPVTLLSSLITVAAEQNESAAFEKPQENEFVEVKENAPPAIDTGSSQWRTVRMRVTAYCPCPRCCGRFADGVTACGHVIMRGDHLAAADKKYPFGTEIIVPGYNDDQPIKVLDRGGAIKGNRLDILFSSHTQAVRWGVRYIEVKIKTGDLNS
jgi:3D (Asp-Asp-Asp) domain-containing protein